MYPPNEQTRVSGVSTGGKKGGGFSKIYLDSTVGELAEGAGTSALGSSFVGVHIDLINELANDRCSEKETERWEGGGKRKERRH
jgi:hypothetical protein